MHLSYDVAVSMDFHHNCPLATQCFWLLNQMMADQSGTWRPQELSSVGCMLGVSHQDSGTYCTYCTDWIVHNSWIVLEFLPLLCKVRIKFYWQGLRIIENIRRYQRISTEVLRDHTYQPAASRRATQRIHWFVHVLRHPPEHPTKAILMLDPSTTG